MLDTYTDAWNRYDSHTLAMLFTQDCDYVMVSGGNTHGREALETSFARNFSSNLKNSTKDRFDSPHALPGSGYRFS